MRKSPRALRDLVDRHGGKSLALYGGGGQGNHAGGAYATGFLRALGSRHVFNALSQEKTGDFWVNGHMFGSQTCHTAEDVHHCDLLFVIGANPWIAHGFPNARDHLNQIRKDPARKMIVIDPRRSETAEMADLHLAVRPGADAFLLGAILATLVRRDALDHDFIAQHTTGFDEVKAALLRIPVAEWAAAADIPLDQIERCVDMIAAAKAMTVRVELGIQQGVNSTLNSYLEKLLIMLTGSFGRKGTNQLHSWLQPLWGNSPNQQFAATSTEVIGGLLPPNVFPKAVLNDHPDRLRGVWIDSSNPANTAANTAEVEKALAALELCVVVDVAMTETARLAHYVLPASSQYEKTEFTLFNFEFPTNYFHVRAGVVPPLDGTLPEPEIYTRLARALGLLAGRQRAGAAARGRLALACRIRSRASRFHGRQSERGGDRRAGALSYAWTDAARRHRGRGSAVAGGAVMREAFARGRAPRARRQRRDGRTNRSATPVRRHRRGSAAAPPSPRTTTTTCGRWSAIPTARCGLRSRRCCNGWPSSIPCKPEHRRTIPSYSPPGSGACSTPTRFFAIRPGGATIPTARFSSTPRISKRSVRATANGSPSHPLPAASWSVARWTTACAGASSLCRMATASPIRQATANA